MSTPTVLTTAPAPPRTARPARPEPNIRLQNVSITFGEHRALDAVNLDLAAGQVVGLVGENGSGKSTLIKILNGVYRPDPVSRIFVRGQEIFPSQDPAAFRRHGISFVHQDLGLVPALSITENLMHEKILHARSGMIRWGRLHREAAVLLRKFGIAADPRHPVASLTDTEKALVAILRAVEELGERKTLLVLDEPTVFLPRSGTDLLFGLIRALLDEYDLSVLLVTHDLEEVIANSDMIAVLKGGQLQCTLPSAEQTPTSLGVHMVGRSVDAARPARTARRDEVALACTDLNAGRAAGVSFTVQRGEILGLTGLAGSGFEDVLPALYGATDNTTGVVRTPAGDSTSGTPRRSLAAGVIYVPADRKTEGGMLGLSVQENAILPRLSSINGALGLSGRKLSAYGVDFTARYDVRPADPGREFRLLSGGNQQKVVLGKWLDTAPSVILLQDPTQGIDVGAREVINTQIIAAANEGAAVLCATTDYEQLALICDRVLVFAEGQVVAEIGGDLAFDRHHIALRVMQGSHEPTIREVG